MHPPNQALNPHVEPQVLYQTNNSFTQSLRDMREKMHHLCHKHMNRPVRIQMMDGTIYDGVIVNVDRGILYIQMQQPVMQRILYPDHAYNYMPSRIVLPLILYELLTISALDK